MRSASVTRNTNETKIQFNLNLDSQENSSIETGHGFLDHMLEQIHRHGRLGLMVQAAGDLQVDVHHLAEDVGIVLGQALQQALADKRGIERYADAFVPMDETLAHVVLDISGRAHLEFSPEELNIFGDASGFNIFHLREFLRGFVNHASLTLHVRVLHGREAHHVMEAIVKAFARALFAATRISGTELPSTKGSL